MPVANGIGAQMNSSGASGVDLFSVQSLLGGDRGVMKEQYDTFIKQFDADPLSDKFTDPSWFRNDVFESASSEQKASDKHMRCFFMGLDGLFLTAVRSRNLRSAEERFQRLDLLVHQMASVADTSATWKEFVVNAQGTVFYRAALLLLLAQRKLGSSSSDRTQCATGCVAAAQCRLSGEQWTTGWLNAMRAATVLECDAYLRRYQQLNDGDEIAHLLASFFQQAKQSADGGKVGKLLYSATSTSYSICQRSFLLENLGNNRLPTPIQNAANYLKAMRPLLGRKDLLDRLVWLSTNADLPLDMSHLFHAIKPAFDTIDNCESVTLIDIEVFLKLCAVWSERRRALASRSQQEFVPSQLTESLTNGRQIEWFRFALQPHLSGSEKAKLKQGIQTIRLQTNDSPPVQILEGVAIYLTQKKVECEAANNTLTATIQQLSDVYWTRILTLVKKPSVLGGGSALIDGIFFASLPPLNYQQKVRLEERAQQSLPQRQSTATASPLQPSVSTPIHGSDGQARELPSVSAIQPFNETAVGSKSQADADSMVSEMRQWTSDVMSVTTQKYEEMLDHLRRDNEQLAATNAQLNEQLAATNAQFIADMRHSEQERIREQERFRKELMDMFQQMSLQQQQQRAPQAPPPPPPQPPLFPQGAFWPNQHMTTSDIYNAQRMAMHAAAQQQQWPMPPIQQQQPPSYQNHAAVMHAAAIMQQQQQTAYGNSGNDVQYYSEEVQEPQQQPVDFSNAVQLPATTTITADVGSTKEVTPVSGSLASSTAVPSSQAQQTPTVVEQPKPKPEKAAVTSGFGAQFKPKPGSWMCDGCMVNNTSDVEVCVCCGASKPGVVPKAVSGASGGIFGATTFTSSAADTKPSSGFSFGFTPKAANSTPAANPTPATVADATTVVQPTSLFGIKINNTTPTAATTTTTGDDGKMATSFTFSTKPAFAFKSSILATPKVDKEEKKVDPKPSPFATFSFSPATTAGGDLSKTGIFGQTVVANKPTFGGEPMLQTTKAPSVSPEKTFARQRTASATSAGSTEADNYEPNVQFAPVCPLPELVEETTGEEGEEVLFCERAKLYRYVPETKEYKERGVGDLKLLLGKQGFTRLVMRRDQVFKVCANHRITPGMELRQLAKSDRAFFWLCCDFSEGTLQTETLAAKFKTPEVAQKFKSAFEIAVANAVGDTPVKSKQEVVEEATTEAKKPVEVFAKTAAVAVNVKPEETASKAPTDGHVFGRIGGDAGGLTSFAALTQSTTFGGAGSFSRPGCVGLDAAASTTLFGGPKSTERRRTESGEGGADEQYEPNVDFAPVCPLPDLVEEKTGEEEEVTVFCERAKLFRYAETKEFKERGVGDLKLLFHPKTGKVRLLMRREQVLKVCANHQLTSDMQLRPMAQSGKAWLWACRDFSDGQLVPETFAARFKTVELAQQFNRVVTEIVRRLVDGGGVLKSIDGLAADSTDASTVVDSTATKQNESIPSTIKNVGVVRPSLFGGSPMTAGSGGSSSFSFKLNSSSIASSSPSTVGGYDTAAETASPMHFSFKLNTSAVSASPVTPTPSSQAVNGRSDLILKYQLPTDFYDFETKNEECVGCDGCASDEYQAKIFRALNLLAYACGGGGDVGSEDVTDGGLERETEDTPGSTTDESDVQPIFDCRATLQFVKVATSPMKPKAQVSEMGVVRIVVDPDLECAYRVMFETDAADGRYIMSHPIVQELEKCVSHSAAGRSPWYVRWSALDFAENTPRRIDFQLNFNNANTQQRFYEKFIEGCKIARENNISEFNLSDGNDDGDEEDTAATLYQQTLDSLKQHVPRSTEE